VAADEIKDTAGTEPAAAGDQPEATPAADKPQAKPARRAAKTDTTAAAKVSKKATAKAEAKPAAEESTKADKPAAKARAGAEKKPAAEKKPTAPKAKKAAAEKPIAEKAAEEKPAETKPAAEKKPAARKKAVAEPAAEKPVAKERKPRQAKTPKPPRPQLPKPGPMQGTIVDAEGRLVETVALNAARFGVAPDVNTLHLVVRAEQAARRRGTASSKTRGEVTGTTAKMYRQKGTGRARAGSVKSPVRTGGGVVFGPRPRDYSMKVNRKVVRKALAMALSSRAEAGNVFVTRGLELQEPSTRTVDRLLVTMNIEAPVLLVTSDEPAVAKSVRNLAYAETAEVRELTTETVLRARSLVFTERAFGALDQA